MMMRILITHPMRMMSHQMEAHTARRVCSQEGVPQDRDPVQVLVLLIPVVTHLVASARHLDAPLPHPPLLPRPPLPSPEMTQAMVLLLRFFGCMVGQLTC